MKNENEINRIENHGGIEDPDFIADVDHFKFAVRKAQNARKDKNIAVEDYVSEVS